MSKFVKENITQIVYGIILVVIGSIFFFFIGTRGYVIERDSIAFIEARMYGSYIVYPKFLEICRLLFGKGSYLEWVCLIQGLLSLTMSVIITEYIRKNYQLNYVYGVIIFLCTFGPYAYSLPQYVSSHGIMTEGLAFPLFYLWMICALQIYLKRKNIWFLPLIIVTLIMAYTRTQLMLFVIICFVLVIERIVSFIYKKININRRKLYVKVCVLAGIIGIFLGGKVFLLFVEHNIYSQMTDAVAGRVFCTVEESDADLFEGRNRELFLGIYDEIESMETRQCYFRTGIRQWEDIAKATNENTKMLSRIIRPYYPEIEMEELNDVKGELAYAMLLEHWDDYLVMTGTLLIQSLVVSIFVHPEFAYIQGYIIAILLYIFGIGSIICGKKKYHVDNRYIIPILLTFLVILFISLITNILFMGLQRYVVYPFGCFYISLVVLYSEIARIMRTKDK